MSNCIKLVNDLKPEEKFMRDAYCNTLMELAENDKRIVALDADLANAMGMKPFREKYSDQFFDCGIQEANMIGVACGLSVCGKIPFTHTFATFASRRVCDQIFMSGVYADSNVKIVGSDPGITAQINGGTHMPFEDMGIMLLMPKMTVLEPTDVTMLKWMIKEMAHNYGMYYMRLVRKSCIKIFEEGTKFEMGKAVHLKDGKDVTIISSGYCVAESLKAYDILQKKGISARIENMFCWKPIDEDCIINAAKETGAIVTAENHHTLNGLGSTVADVVVRNTPVPMEHIGIGEEFGEVGKVDYLSERFKLNAQYIADAAIKAISRK